MGRPGLSLHRKFKKLARDLAEGTQAGFGPVLARGVLELLWDGAYECGDAYLGDTTSVEGAVGWAGRAGLLCTALLEAGGPGHAGFIEEGGSPWWPEGAPGTFRVHDLFDHAPEYVSGRQRREAERKKGKVCEGCGTTYRSPDPRSKYHSDACRKAAWRRQHPPGDGRETDSDGSIRPRDGHETDRDGTPAPAPAPAPQILKEAAASPLRLEAPPPPKPKKGKKQDRTDASSVEPLRQELIELIRARGVEYLDTSAAAERTNLKRALAAGATAEGIKRAFRVVYDRGGWNPRIQDVARVLTAASERQGPRNGTGAGAPQVSGLRDLTGIDEDGHPIYGGGEG